MLHSQTRTTQSIIYIDTHLSYFLSLHVALRVAVKMHDKQDKTKQTGVLKLNVPLDSTKFSPKRYVYMYIFTVLEFITWCGISTPSVDSFCITRTSIIWRTHFHIGGHGNGSFCFVSMRLLWYCLIYSFDALVQIILSHVPGTGTTIWVFQCGWSISRWYAGLILGFASSQWELSL